MEYVVSFLFENQPHKLTIEPENHGFKKTSFFRGPFSGFMLHFRSVSQNFVHQYPLSTRGVGG